ncbi:MAG: tRNA uridine-5-carboxymethylaminomethyl(34) synthesis GTPase MnmE [Kiritimatiellia bacterium]
MNTSSDTITAIATAPGASGIAIVRVSGHDSLSIADRTYRGTPPPPSQRPARTFIRGQLTAPGAGDDSAAIDEVILLIYRAPHSYTCEDVVEIQCHGGRTAAARVLRAVVDAGARHADPGEFTRRAFLNGRIDLPQAEAVADLIYAKSARAAATALEQLTGNLSASVTATYDNILASVAQLEASLDFPDYDTPPDPAASASSLLRHAHDSTAALLSTWDEGHLLREGARAVITGSPNAGKSTLLNRLLGNDRAIVTSVPGTTRDTVEEQFILNGVPVTLVDTAGLRRGRSEPEARGIERTERAILTADIILHVIDTSAELTHRDLDILKRPATPPVLLLLNKADLPRKATLPQDPRHPSVPVSLLSARDVPTIRDLLSDILGIHESSDPHAAISERHRSILQDVQNLLNEAISLLAAGDEANQVLAVTSLRSALSALGTLLGKDAGEDVLDSIFSRFCIGK